MTGLPVVRTVTSTKSRDGHDRGGPAMPQYLDHHPTIPDLPPETVAFITERLTSGQPDEFGEVGLHLFVGAEQTWCHTEAPSPDAVRRSHQALGIDLDPTDIAEVQVLP
jgi:hypothetical protein